MPPATRKPTSPFTKPTAEKWSKEPVEKPVEKPVETTNGDKREYSKRVTVEDVGLDTSVGFTTVVDPSQVPKIVRERGRSNLFDDPIMASWRQLDRQTGFGPWVKGRVGNLEAAEKACRNSASYMAANQNIELGVEVRSEPDNAENPTGPGTLWFRAKIRRKVNRNKK